MSNYSVSTMFDGLKKECPAKVILTVFNNDHYSPSSDSMNYSAVYEIVPPTDSKGNYVIEKGKPYGPDKPVWSYIAPDTLSFWSSFISGAQRMKQWQYFY